ncbi:MAG TPA: FtsX-like permease family protein [Dissulfurispiraceae bacterium]|nr:FtsX-like permease family protein [Dissulfurispiraceae bacterium]
MSFFKLARLFVSRSIMEEKFLTLLSVIGVALGIGLFIGVKVASDRAISSFESDIKGLNSGANYEISDTSGLDFNERIYPVVADAEKNSFPVLKAAGYLPDLKDTIVINGIYTVKSMRLVRGAGTDPHDMETFFKTLDGILVTKGFAVRHAIKKNDTLRAFVYDRVYTLKIAGIMDSSFMPSNTALMDIGNFQEYFGKAGFLSAIDLITDDDTALTIQKILPPSVSIEKKKLLLENQKSLLASFRYNLQFVSLIAILVGVFLLYNTIFISVIKRRTEIGVLRALGAGKKTVVMLFVLHGTMLGVVGSLFGLLLGQGAAYFSVIAVTKTISSMYSAISITDYLIGKDDIVSALCLGFCISLAASLLPSFEASRIRPNESAKAGTFEAGYKRRRKLFPLAGAILIIMGLAGAYLDYRARPFSFPFLAYAGILLLLLGFTLSAPLYFSTVLNMFKKPAAALLGVTATLAWGDMRGSTYRFSVALMSVAISTSLIIALFILIFSFRHSLKLWISQNIAADIYIKPISCASNFCFFPLSDDISNIVKGFPEVKGIDRFRTLHLDFRGRKIVAGFGDLAAQMLYSPPHNDRGMEKRDEELLHGRQVSISSYLSLKYGLKPGDSIELRTPDGIRSFKIYSTFSSYSTTSGFIYLDRKWLKKYWGLDDATQIAVYLNSGVDIDNFAAKLRGALSQRYSVAVMNNRELREKVLAIFNKSFAITYAIELISIIVSLIGVINTLLALVLERKREISIIRYLGGSWRQIESMLVLSAGVVGISGIAMGALIGPIMSSIFIQVINKISFGWEIHFSVPALYLIAVILMLFLSTLAAGLIPARVARRTDPKRFISFE